MGTAAGTQLSGAVGPCCCLFCFEVAQHDVIRRGQGSPPWAPACEAADVGAGRAQVACAPWPCLGRLPAPHAASKAAWRGLGWVHCIGQIACLGSVTLHPAAQKKADCPVPGVSREVGSCSSLLSLGRLYTEKASLAFLVLQLHTLALAGMAHTPLVGQEQSQQRSVNTRRWMAGAGDKSCHQFPG